MKDDSKLSVDGGKPILQALIQSILDAFGWKAIRRTDPVPLVDKELYATYWQPVIAVDLCSCDLELTDAEVWRVAKGLAAAEAELASFTMDFATRHGLCDEWGNF